MHILIAFLFPVETGVYSFTTLKNVFSDLFSLKRWSFLHYIKRGELNKAQEEPQAEDAANPRHQEEEKKWHRSMCA